MNQNNILLSKYKEIPQRELNQIVYPTGKIETPFGKKQVIYADFIASGRPSPVIEKYIVKNVYSKYSNTHSNAANGICMKNEIENVKRVIKSEYNIDDTYEVLFKGSGVTGAINYLIDCMDFKKFAQVFIFISTYEHYSNHLPWIELTKEHKHIKLAVIPLNRANKLDVAWYEARLKEITGARARGKTLIITSIIHCSNLTGYFTPIHEIKKVMDRSKSAGAVEKYLFSDMACSAPYVKIDGSVFDAFFISPHKFVGGVETPGILVAKTCLFQKDHSSNPGGSCIKKTRYNHIEYSDDIEIRENAGTPNIVGIIKIGQCLLLKRELQDLISHNEEILYKTADKWAAFFARNYKTFFYINYRNSPERLSIFTFHVTNLHYNFIVVLLNDLYGIQSRGGISCDGLFNDYVKDRYGGKTGFCRVSLHWTMTRKNVRDIFAAIEYVIKNGEKYLPFYKYDADKNLWFFARAPNCVIK